MGIQQAQLLVKTKIAKNEEKNAKPTSNSEIAASEPMLVMLTVEACDRRTDGRTDTAAQFIMPPIGAGA